ADELIRSVERLAAHHPGTIRSVELQIGALTAVNQEALQTAFAVLRDGTRLAVCELLCRALPVVVACTSCGQQGEPEDSLLLRCPACGSGRVEVTSGRQLDIVRISLEDASADAQDR
ncbi:MAG: hydrogenase maturation nickel metallochaperone HypA, partial [Deltaproteobacteria bacterium]|nr:hydrogenase maturation nickel metallochaperone HypA [Deltaproteobacteria bacterium]